MDKENNTKLLYKKNICFFSFILLSSRQMNCILNTFCFSKPLNNMVVFSIFALAYLYSRLCCGATVRNKTVHVHKIGQYSQKKYLTNCKTT